MQFLTAILALAASTVVAANSIHFVNQDSTTRTIYFTGNPGMEVYAPLQVPGSSTADQTFADGWIGNFYSVSEGAANVPGMLGEVRFGGYSGANFFDVSSIVNALDTDGVKEIFPANSNEPVSGCQSVPCSNMYNAPDDIATLSTDDSDLICLLGNLGNARRAKRVARSFVVS